MDWSSFGRQTYNTRVEAWECDHNQHWNVRNYLRSFQMAGFVTADMSGAARDIQHASTLHARFHRELFQASMVKVRSARIADGEYAGAIAHVLISDGRLSATALEQSNYDACALPGVKAVDVKLALPRGVTGGPHEPDQPPVPEDAWRVELGMVQPLEVDHTGTIMTDQLMRRIATASSDLLNDLGFTPEFVETARVSRMGVEIKITRFDRIPVGTRLSGTGRIAEVNGKSVVIRHQIFRPDGTIVAAADQGLVTVDMTTRRAIEVPDFLAKAVSD